MDQVQIPQAGALLHADCNEKQVACELSRYFLQTRPEASVDTATCFMATVQVSDGGPSISMVMKTLGDTDEETIKHPKLNLSLNPQGTVQAAGESLKKGRKFCCCFVCLSFLKYPEMRMRVLEGK